MKESHNLYLTADRVGIPTGGGTVTQNESLALASLGKCYTLGRDELSGTSHSARGDPWFWDDQASWEIRVRNYKPKLTHVYAGTFSETIRHLQSIGSRVCYTAAAHRISDSREAHESLGIPYNYPHLTDPEQWRQYLQGYLDADLMICPSQHSATVKQEYGRTRPIVVIPHGCHLPEAPRPLPSGEFTVGYLGAYGPDKGVRHLLEAWKALNYPDARLLLGGRDSQSEFVTWLIRTFGGGRIERVGWLDSVSDFYNACHLVSQPSVSEGFGLEVLEAMAHSRPVVCSTGAGACDIVPQAYRYDYHDVRELAAKIDLMREVSARQKGNGNWLWAWRALASDYTWEKVRAMYVRAWEGLLGEVS